MQPTTSASSRWSQLDGKRRSFLTRCEKYASFTLPKLCPPDNYDQNVDELQHDYQALGAQGVNHLANKVMLALFAPSRPFFRLDPSDKLKKELADAQVDTSKMAEALAQGEKAAVSLMDRLAMRPALYETVKHLIVIGNVLMDYSSGSLQAFGIKSFCVRRSGSGTVIEVLIKLPMAFDELEDEVQQHLANYAEFKNTPTQDVTLFKWLTRNADGSISMSQWVNQYRLPKKFDGKWPEADCPYRVATWDLTAGAHYGSGLVEDYQGDFAALSILSQAQVTGAVLSSEFRWLANPAGMTKPEDLENSENGAVLPGNKDDITLVESSKNRDLSVLIQMIQEYSHRISRGFLMVSAVTRQAERVTAEEIRTTANELETAYGGVYSRLAVDVQDYLAHWLMKRTGLSSNGGLQPTIVTGLAALSRQGDLDDLRMWIADMAPLANLPEMFQKRLKFDTLSSAFAAPRQIVVSSFLKSEEQVQQEDQAAQQQLQQQEAIKAASNAGSQIAVNNSKQGNQ